MQPDAHTLWKIYALLQQMGASSSYTGFFHTAYAVFLTIGEPRRLLLVTKWLYPDVAEYFHTSWSAWNAISAQLSTWSGNHIRSSCPGSQDVRWRNGRPVLNLFLFWQNIWRMSFQANNLVFTVLVNRQDTVTKICACSYSSAQKNNRASCIYNFLH